LRICILTRGDLFPDNHGGAVKIVRAAEAVVRLGGEVVLVDDDRDGYLRRERSSWVRRPFPARFRAAQEWSPLPLLQRLAPRACRRVGYPDDEAFLYSAQFDPAWTARALQVGLMEGTEVFQAEFPGFASSAWLASRLLRRAPPARFGRLPRQAPTASLVEHNVEWQRLSGSGLDVSWIRPVEQAVARLMDHVVTCSSDDRRALEDGGLPPGRATVIPHGVDVEAFRAAAAAPGRGVAVRARYGIDLRAPLLFFHGTLHYQPNTDAVRFIAEQLLPLLLAARPDLRVLICGLNPPRYYSHPAIVYAGPVDDLPDCVAAADVALCPVYSGGGTRLKLLEYLAAARPVVSSRKGAEGLTCLGDDGAPAALHLAESAAQFAFEVLSLLDNPAAARTLGARGQAYARRFDWSAHGRVLLDLYRGQGRGEDWSRRLRDAPVESPPAPPLDLAIPPIDLHLPADRVPSKPLTLLLLINRGCNLRCSFCDLWEGSEELPLERLLPILDDAVAIGTRTLVITGGEPFLHKDLFAAVRQARSRGLAVNITTNGTLVDRRWDELIGSGVSSVSMSLDGLAATHDRLRGRKGAWKKTVASLDRVLGAGIPVSVYFVATRDNVHELPALFDLVHKRGAGFDFWPVNDSPDLYLRPEDRPAWEAAVQHISAVLPDVAARAAYYREGLGYHQGVGVPVRCLGLVDQYGVTFQGELLPCCVWGGDGLAVGNVFERPLAELWRSPQVQQAREHLYGAGCTAGCFNHSLYEFTASTGLPFRVEAASD
jgi:MoaA/NifB/PqqE/SkfB family radical SAM enzyme/glycosyltransferase involved in cell wall biosynthesis